jgi:hypothetical protein
MLLSITIKRPIDRQFTVTWMSRQKWRLMQGAERRWVGANSVGVSSTVNKFFSTALNVCCLLFFLNTFLLVYNSCTGSFIAVFAYRHSRYPSLVHSLHYSPCSPHHLLKWLWHFSVPYSYKYRKNIDRIHPSLPTSFIPLLPSSTSPLTWPVLRSFPSLSVSFKCLFIVLWGFALLFYW